MTRVRADWIAISALLCVRCDLNPRPEDPGFGGGDSPGAHEMADDEPSSPRTFAQATEGAYA